MNKEHKHGCGCNSCEEKKAVGKTSMEEAGGVAVGFVGHIHGFNADVAERFKTVMLRTGKYVEKESGGPLLGHIKIAIFHEDGTGITLNLTNMANGVEQHGVMDPCERVDFNFMAAVLDVDHHELEHEMAHFLDDSGIDYHLEAGHHHHHDHGDCGCHDHKHGDCEGHDHKHGECGCGGHSHGDDHVHTHHHIHGKNRGEHDHHHDHDHGHGSEDHSHDHHHGHDHSHKHGEGCGCGGHSHEHSHSHDHKHGDCGGHDHKHGDDCKCGGHDHRHDRGGCCGGHGKKEESCCGKETSGEKKSFFGRFRKK